MIEFIILSAFLLSLVMIREESKEKSILFAMLDMSVYKKIFIVVSFAAGIDYVLLLVYVSLIR